jgi:L,D-transpeptidase YbiS
VSSSAGGVARIIVSLARQMMVVELPGESTPRSYPVSTSRYGAGEEMDSLMTPRGLHEVVERYGDGLAAGSVMVSRVFTGEVVPEDAWPQEDGEDRILSRILRLTGCEPGRNRGGTLDSYARMIYIHGTNQEQHVGVRPSSHGCIRMKNHDVIELYQLTGGLLVQVEINEHD